MDDLKKIAELLPPAKAPTAAAREAAYDRMLAATSDRASGRRTSAGPTGRLRAGRPARLVAAASSAMAIGAIAGLLFSLGPAGPSAREHHPVAEPPLTARAILLTAASNVSHTPAAGRYWHSTEIDGWIGAGGTRAHPYDITSPTFWEFWLSPQAGKRDYSFSEILGAVPSTPADYRQWRAAGSPTSWNYGTHPTTAGPTRLSGSYWPSRGTVGYLEGDLSYWTARQFAALPGRAGPLRKVLRREAMQTWSARHLAGGGATANQLIWSESVQILRSPVSWQVRAAALRVLAGLPGVRSFGHMRDPRGRLGYGIGGGPVALSQIAVIDVKTGALLATEIVGTPVGLSPQQNAGAHGLCRGEFVLLPEHPGFTKLPQHRGIVCTPPYFQRVYRGQLTSWNVIVSANWTNARPSVPVTPVLRDQGY
jgi:hypothetical protein